MAVKTSLKEFQQYCLTHHITFVSYVMPGETNPVSLFVRDSKATIIDHISRIEDRSGFVFSPFQSEDNPVIVIPDKEKLTGWDFELDSFPLPVANPNLPHQNFHISSYAEYIEQIEEIKRNLALGKAKKVVLSRIKTFEEIDAYSLPEVFAELVRIYPHAFVYLLYSPESGIWLGATPESLIEMNEKGFSTMALAGTKAFSFEGLDVEWAEKEIKEQEYVVSYVRQKLSKAGYRYHESERQTVRAGNVVHLRTVFDGEVIDNHAEWKELVRLLYPTPAICGTDDETTLQLIHQVEKHKREYYAGIIGPFDANGKTSLFINLRCMKVTGTRAVLYAGGGILGGSSASKEWEETELKFNTLIQVLQNIEKNMKPA
jgi:isochorismate synthase